MWNTDREYLKMAKDISENSTCLRRKCGAVLASYGGYVVSFGYNDMPHGCKKCNEVGCMRQELNVPSGQRHELCRAVHAEQNAILGCFTSSISELVSTSTMYITTQPCVICAKLIINSGIKRIVYPKSGTYPDELSKVLLQESGIEVVEVEE